MWSCAVIDDSSGINTEGGRVGATIQAEGPKRGEAAGPRGAFDYSKWDHIGDGDDDGDSQSDEGSIDEGDWEHPLDSMEQARLQEVLKTTRMHAFSRNNWSDLLLLLGVCRRDLLLLLLLLLLQLCL